MRRPCATGRGRGDRKRIARLRVGAEAAAVDALHAGASRRCARERVEIGSQCPGPRRRECGLADRGEGGAHFLAHLVTLRTDRRPEPRDRLRGGVAPSRRTSLPARPPARPRQPACAAPTTLPASSAKNTGMQSAIITTHTRAALARDGGIRLWATLVRRSASIDARAVHLLQPARLVRAAQCASSSRAAARRSRMSPIARQCVDERAARGGAASRDGSDPLAARAARRAARLKSRGSGARQRHRLAASTDARARARRRAAPGAGKSMPWRVPRR